MLSEFSQCLALLKNAIYFFFPIAYKIFIDNIEHLFPFNWSFWLFVVGMAAMGLCELSWNQRYWISRLLSKKEYFRRESVDHFCDKAGWAFGRLTIQAEEGFVTNEGVMFCGLLGFKYWRASRNVIVSLFGGCNIKFNGCMCVEKCGFSRWKVVSIRYRRYTVLCIKNGYEKWDG